MEQGSSDVPIGDQPVPTRTSADTRQKSGARQFFVVFGVLSALAVPVLGGVALAGVLGVWDKPRQSQPHSLSSGGAEATDQESIDDESQPINMSDWGYRDESTLARAFAGEVEDRLTNGFTRLKDANCSTKGVVVPMRYGASGFRYTCTAHLSNGFDIGTGAEAVDTVVFSVAVVEDGSEWEVIG